MSIDFTTAIQKLDAQIAELKSTLNERGIGLASAINIYPRAIKLSGQENVQLAQATNKTLGQIENLQAEKTKLQNEQIAAQTTTDTRVVDSSRVTEMPAVQEPSKTNYSPLLIIGAGIAGLAVLLGRKKR